MSLLSDALEGNFANFGNDIAHAPSSLASHPDELAETLGGAGLLLGGAGALGLLDFGGAAAAEGGAAAAGEGATLAEGADLGGALGLEDIGAAAAADLASTVPAELSGDALDFFGIGSGAALGGGVPADVIGGLAPDFGGDISAGDAIGAASPDVTPDTIGADVPPPDTVPGAPTAPADTAAAGSQFSTVPAGTPTVSATTTPSGGVAGVGQGGVAAPATSGGSVAGSGGGFMGTLNSVVSSPLTKLALGVAPLALTLGMGEAQLPSSAQQLQGQAGALSAQGQQDLAQARAGVLNAGQTAVIAQNRQNLENQWRQVLFNQGVTDIRSDARWPQIEAQIDAQITAQTAQLIQQNITNALAETGQAAQALTSIANMQFQADANFTNNIVNATKALGLAVGSGGGFKLVQA